MYLLIDNYDSFTYNIYQYLKELTDEPVEVRRSDTVTIEDISRLKPAGIIISPGPGRPEDAGISVDAVREFAGKIPILGICLGHQAIGYAFGADIIQAKYIVHGKAQPIRHDGNGIFRAVPSPAVFTRYHSLVIDPATLPEDFEITAGSADGEIMGIRHKKYVIEGVQFHPESMASENGLRLLRNFLSYKRDAFQVKIRLEQVIRGENLTQSQAAEFMEELTEGNLSSPQIAGYLTAVNAKGITAEEIAGCASVLQKKRKTLEVDKPLLDTCGTGGDGLNTFNISSMTAITAAACGAFVAKHGNRAVSSVSGSADFYKALGFSIDLSPRKTEKLIIQTGFGFLFAPLYHGAMRFAAEARRALGIKTIMNLLGPLVNPAGAENQLIGVFSEEFCMPIAEAARILGIKRVMVVHGREGLDELSVTAPSRIVFVHPDGNIEDNVFHPSSIGLPDFSVKELAGGSAEENAETALQIMKGEGPRAITESVCLNTGAALVVYGSAESIEDGYLRAKEAFTGGLVRAKYEEIRKDSALLQSETTE